MEYIKNTNTLIKHIIAIPIVSSLFFPLVILDIWAEIYHRICFPLYKVPYLKRNNYIKIDRHKLKYLSFWQKAYCVYCGYANGIVGYWVKMAGVTEKYWCGIQHEKNANFIPPKHHEEFSKFNDEEDFKQKYKS